MRRETSRWVMTVCVAAAVLQAAGGCSGCYESHSAGDAGGDGDVGLEDFAELHETVDPPDGMEPGDADAFDGFDSFDHVIDLDVYEPFPDPGDPDPWVPDMWDVPFDYMDIPPDYLPDPAGCGNGIVDPGEECDDGNTNDHDECTSRCLFPRCGDGSVWYGMEDCDPPGTIRPCTTTCGTTGGEWCEAYCRWTGECIPPQEVCGNGVDDDCDGIVDSIVRLTSNLKISSLPIGEEGSRIVWTGSEFAILWRSFDNDAILSRLDAWGRKVDWDRELFTYASYDGRSTGFFWTGSLFGLFWIEENPYGSGYYDAYFEALDASGNPVSAPLLVTSNFGCGVFMPSWSGSEYGTLFEKTCSSLSFFSLSPDGSSLSTEVNIRNWDVTSERYYPLYFSWAGSQYAMLYNYTPEPLSLDYEGRMDLISAEGSITRTLDFEIPSGSSLGMDFNYDVFTWTGSYFATALGFSAYLLISDPAGGNLVHSGIFTEGDLYGAPALIWTGSELGLFWNDRRGENFEIYFTRASPEAVKLIPDVRLTYTPSLDPGPPGYPSAAWTGSSYGATWRDYDGVSNDIYFTHFLLCP